MMGQTDNGGRKLILSRFVAQLVLGLRVMARLEQHGDRYWPGTVHRIEPTRARINFDSKPLCWMKV